MIMKHVNSTKAWSLLVLFGALLSLQSFARTEASTSSEQTLTTNDVFFFVGSPLALLGATVSLSGEGFYESFVTSDPFSGEFIANVPYGTYTYSVSKECYDTVTGEVVVDFNDGMGVSVFATPSPATTNDVFFFVGSPLAMLDATVSLSAPGYYESFVTSDPWSGEFIADVPFGTYTYSVSKDCHETITGEVVVDCNGGMGVSVFATPSPVSINTAVTSAHGVLSVEAADVAYQWVDCGNASAPVLGATGATFAPSMSGSYAVQIIASGCLQSSGCTDIVVEAGCTYSDASNYAETATIDDGTCNFENACPADLNGDGLIAATDLLAMLAAFGTSCD